MIRNATPADAPAIAAIYNDAVCNTTAIWNEVEVDTANRVDWMQARQAAGLPVLVLEEAGEVIGYASYGPFRAFDGFRGTVEHSIYIRTDLRGGGRGRALLEGLIEHARADGYHVMVGAIEAGNAGSMALHSKLGFTHVGTMPQVGQKFGRWLDLALLQLVLDRRPQP
ncbi:GNAT family N-acetyltransferase [Sedimentimonas flavescens]|uniref:GNAT family N-acetyltransferase n=1 Tax=Sedimentimonas flavescens TaxID=2851012 RepID=A0ABT3A2Q6_9RHOB|nr:GNAT family N-acetyltransferase [Sedimentimonas flavescens]MCV2880282.1 GNAT family N-acetyltransferase [Sedimentimonas flavescens]